MLAIVLLILWPVAEVYVAIRIAEAIGVLWTLLLLIASWPIGRWAIRTEGRAAWRRLGEAVAAGRSPGREVLTETQNTSALWTSITRKTSLR